MAVSISLTLEIALLRAFHLTPIYQWGALEAGGRLQWIGMQWKNQVVLQGQTIKLLYSFVLYAEKCTATPTLNMISRKGMGL